MNTQPLHFYVVTGNRLDRRRKLNTERNLAGIAPSREIRSHGAYEGVRRRQQIEIAAQLFQPRGSSGTMRNAVRTGGCAGSGSVRNNRMGSQRPSALPLSQALPVSSAKLLSDSGVPTAQPKRRSIRRAQSSHQAGDARMPTASICAATLFAPS